MFPQLQEDFERAMPLSEYITSSGAKNLAAHFPLNSFTPDLGEFLRVHPRSMVEHLI